MGKGHFNLPLVNERAKMQASFMFGDDLYQSLKRKERWKDIKWRRQFEQIFGYAKLKDFTYGLLGTEHV